MRAIVGMAISLLKLRIGVAIAASALAGIAVANGHGLAWWQPIGLALAILEPPARPALSITTTNAISTA